ncbi:hypothetical protein K432DRAFT_384965 [Lepidopterella palustris CBS 459.81]|uniref:Pal1-domain-containing protein n=1 Tax=Lepidopterella palustris CBS 459.81 TaxID=1314670 RepID=A0A8E2E4M6_9PEZI|nr:hypothetical protein K432DRAFT_384965 [Lepidopterella palustris CBS 459.81]
MTSDKEWAAKNLLGPLTEPDPSDETGLNSHFGSTYAPRQQTYPSPPMPSSPEDGSWVEVRSHNTGSSTNTNPFRRGTNNSISKASTLINSRPASSGYPSPPTSASPRRERFSSHRDGDPSGAPLSREAALPAREAVQSHREAAFSSYTSGHPRRSSQPNLINRPLDSSNGIGIARNNSLRERYPGDISHRPLDIIRKDTKLAHRSPHLRREHYPGPDTIDRLDATGSRYHHEGPYDAALLARNTSFESSPIAAIASSNEEALRATPRENIIDAVQRHRPLEGVASVPPGVPDKFGRVLEYEEGADLQREEGGDYRRWPGVEYLPGDLKGKGEPSYSIEKALKDHKTRGGDGEDAGVELQTRTRSRNKSLSHADDRPVSEIGSVSGNATGQSYVKWEGDMRRSNTTGKTVSGGLKKRFGSLRRRK